MARYSKAMKLKKILNHIDGTTLIHVYCFENGNEEEFFKGSAWNCPWWVANLYIDTDEEGEGIYIDIEKETKKPYIGIYVKEGK